MNRRLPNRCLTPRFALLAGVLVDEQRRQFMAVIQDLQQTIKPMIEEAQSGGNPQEIRPRVIKIIEDHEATIETLMSTSQRKQWQAMRGKPFNTL